MENGESLAAVDESDLKPPKVEDEENLESRPEEAKQEDMQTGEEESAGKTENPEPEQKILDEKTPEIVVPKSGEVEAVRMAALDGATYVQYSIDPKTNSQIQVEYVGPAENLQDVATVEYVTQLGSIVTAADIGSQIVQTNNGERVIIPVLRESDRDGPLYEYAPGAQYLPLAQEQLDQAAVVEGHRPDALQAAVESAEVDKMDTLLLSLPTRVDSRGLQVYGSDSPNPGTAGTFEDQGQDPRLLGDAYMQNSMYSTRSSVVGAGLESPTYTQLENAAMSSFNKAPGQPASAAPVSFATSGIYNNPNLSTSYSLKMDQDPIYSIKGQRQEQEQ